MKTDNKSNKNNAILFNPIADIGDTVYHKTDIGNNRPMILYAYTIMGIDPNTREVLTYTMGCSSIEGGAQYYYPHELNTKEEVNA